MAKQVEREIAIMPVGTLHLANPARDVFNVVVDDVLSERQQRELLQIVECLATFGPTRIAVEVTDETTLAERFSAFRRGERPLERSEVEQIGFRLAEKVGLSGLDAVDVVGPFWIPEVDALRTDPRTASAWLELEQEGRAFVARCQQLLDHGAIGEVLGHLNTRDEVVLAAELYSDVLLRIATPDNDAGPRMAAHWFSRNLRILGRVLALAVPGDRVLMLFGHAHVAMF